MQSVPRTELTGESQGTRVKHGFEKEEVHFILCEWRKERKNIVAAERLINKEVEN